MNAHVRRPVYAGTWRGRWIGSTDPGATLFDLDPGLTEQGALFA